MTLTRLYSLVGLAWAILLAPLAAFALFGFALGAAWLLVFGDDPWPDAGLWFLAAPAVLGGLMVALLCCVTARLYGKRMESLDSPQRRVRARRLAIALVVAPFLLVLLLAGRGYMEAEEQRAAMTMASAREAAFAERLAQRQQIAALAVEEEAPGRFAARIRLSGASSGAHRLTWEVRDQAYGRVLLRGAQPLDLRRGVQELALASFTLEELALRYREIVLQGRGGVLVDEFFRMEALLQPQLTAAEQEALPPGERSRLALGGSSLAERASASFPVRFSLR